MAFPPTIPRWAQTVAGALAGNITTPSSGQLDTGWTLDQAPPSANQNWWQQLVYNWTQLAQANLPISTLPVKQFCDPPTLTTTIATFSTDNASTGCPANHLASNGAATGATLVACGGGTTGGTSVEVSVDGGFNWTTTAVTGMTLGASAVYWVPFVSLFVLLDAGTVGKIYTSPTGATWTSQVIGASLFTSLAWSGTTAVLAYAGGIYYSTVVTSTWTNAATVGTTAPQIAFNGTATTNNFCLVGGSTTANCLWTSPTGVTWTAQTAPAVFGNGAVTGGTPIVFADFGNARNIPQVPLQNYLTSVFVVNNALVNGTIYLSPSGATGTWSSFAAPTGWSTSAYVSFWSGNLCYLSGTLAGTSKTGMVFLTSSDGATWTVHQLPVDSTDGGTSSSSHPWTGLAIANGNLVTLQGNISATGTKIWVGPWLGKDNPNFN